MGTVEDLESAELSAGSTNIALWERKQRAVPAAIANRYRLFVSRARGSELWDVEGRRYIDFAAGIGAMNIGHGHPQVLAALYAQAAEHQHTCFHVAAYESYVSLAERLNALAPIDGPCKTLLLTGGAEANENAVKIARARTGRPGVVAFTGGFHGRTLMTLALTARCKPHKSGFGPMPGPVYHLPFPDTRGGVRAEDTLVALDRLFHASLPAEQVAAVIIEPVQGEGGINVAPLGFLRALRECCDRYGIVLIADEIQSGLGRTGRWFAVEHSGVNPDLITAGKSLGGGLPLSAVIGRAALMDSVEPGGLGNTFGGNPLACRTALAVLDVIERGRLLERSRAIGRYLQEAVATLAMGAARGRIGDVRGLGAIVGIELVTGEGRPAPGLARRMIEREQASGLLLLSCGAEGHVIRLLPPLTIGDALLEEGVRVLRYALIEALAEQ